MSITHEQACQLLDYLRGFDHRPVNGAEPDVWVDAAESARWSFEEARSALRELTAGQTGTSGYIRPPDVTGLVRQRREEAWQRREAAERQTRRAHQNQNPATVEHRARAIRGFIAALSAGARIDGPAEPVENTPGARWALSYDCPWCGVAPGGGCLRRDLGTPLRGRVHTSREALLVSCGECRVGIGAPCAGDHPHYQRDIDADAFVAGLGRSANAPAVEPASELTLDLSPAEPPDPPDPRAEWMRHQCPWCQAEPGRSCIRKGHRPAPLGSGAHPSRRALAVDCPECGAEVGQVCASDHPHHPRTTRAGESSTTPGASPPPAPPVETDDDLGEGA